MKRFVYDKMVESYKKVPNEKLVQHILAGNNIESKDRAFANECKSGMTICNIHALFNAIHAVQTAKPEELKTAIDHLSNVTKRAETSWHFIETTLNEMSIDNRCEKELLAMEKRIANNEDCI